MRKVLSIDGGGIKGVFPASFLATIEDSLGHDVARYFDLIVGTSTGGIAALALGLGLPAKKILGFYEQHGPNIFSGNRIVRWFRNLGIAKYPVEGLRTALNEVFAEQRLGDSTTRLVIPSLNLENGEVHLWKTSHHPRLVRDYKESVIDVALSTAAAPSYFPTHRTPGGSPIVDGGIWANNPLIVAAVESIGVLGWPADSLRILSIGCTSTPLDIRWARHLPMGKGYWATKVIDLFMSAQSSASLGMTQLLLNERANQNILRIDPIVSTKFSLDTIAEISSLRGLGETEARKAIPQIQTMFFDHSFAQDFEPCHKEEFPNSNT